MDENGNSWGKIESKRNQYHQMNMFGRGCMVAKLMKVMDDMCVKEDGKFEKSSMHEMQSISWSQKIF